MEKPEKTMNNFSDLRNSAENLLNKRASLNVKHLSEIDTLKLIHELEVHQIELEMQNEELVLTRAYAAELASEKYAELYDFVPSGLFTLSGDGKILGLNKCGAQMLGKERLQAINSLFSAYISSDTEELFQLFISKVFKDKTKETCELTLSVNNQSPIYVHLTGVITQNGEHCLVTMFDITSSKTAEKYGEITREILQILNESHDFKYSIHQIISNLETKTGFDAVGIRLQEGDDFPYFDQTGFSANFLLTENSLIERDENGKVYRKHNGCANLGCTCGLVISGKTDKDNPFFTPGGSWWTNDSFPLLDIPADKDERFHPRNRCIHEGYASVAIVPIRNRNRIIGLIQFNDQHKGRITRQMLVFLEGIASHIGAALMRKQAEELVRKNNSRLELALQTANMAWWEMDVTTGNVIFEKRKAEMLGYPVEKFHHYKDFMALVHPDDSERIMDEMRKHYEGILDKYEVEYRILTKSGVYKWFHDIGTVVSRDAAGRALIVTGLVIDISIRRNAEEIVKIAENRRIAILQTAMDGYWLLNNKGYLLEVNQTYCNMTGYSAGELLTMHLSDLEVVEVENDTTKHIKNVTLMEDDRFESRHRRKDGTVFDVEISLQYQPANGGYFIAFLHDITARKKKDEALKKLNQTLGALSKSNLAMVRSSHELEYLKQVCDIVVEDCGYRMVWIGYADDEETKTIRTVASAGYNNKYIESIKLRWDDSESGRGPTGVAIRTGKMGVCSNMLTDPVFKPWQKEAKKRGFAASIAFPLKIGDKVFGAITIYSDQTDSFQESEIQLLTELANDLSFGITTIRLRVAQQLAEEALSKSHTKLEVLVNERTHQLQFTNDLLTKEIDIRNKSEQKVKLAEEKYRTVADFAYNWEFWTDQYNQMVYCSPSCERITGYNAAEFVQNSQLLLEIIFPDDLNSYMNHKLNEAMVQDANLEFQYRIIRLDGSVRWIGHICQPIFDEKGNFNGSRGSNKDITERKFTEQLLRISNHKYELLSENITDGIFICRDGSFEYVNKALNSIFGYDNQQLQGVQLMHLVLPGNQPELENFLVLNGLVNQSLNVELECFKRDHTTVFVEILLNYVASESAIYGVVHDITGRRQLQKSIIKAIIQTEEKERTHFSKELHDGLGPLLSTIKLYLQWSARPKTNKSREEIIHKAEDILEEALVTVKEISYKLSPHLLTYYGLTSAIQSFVDKLDGSSTMKVTFESNSTRRFELELETAIYRAIIECVNNTIKHAGAGKIWITLEDTGTQIMLQYIDNGVGYNLEETLSARKGLGLFNLQNRIQSIGGKISLFSKPGQGVDYKIIINI